LKGLLSSFKEPSRQKNNNVERSLRGPGKGGSRQFDFLGRNFSEPKA